MPLVEVTLTEGRSADQIRSLIQELHEAVVRSGVAEAPAVRVIVREVPATHWASGGVTIAERRAVDPAPSPGPRTSPSRSGALVLMVREGQGFRPAAGALRIPGRADAS